MARATLRFSVILIFSRKKLNHASLCVLISYIQEFFLLQAFTFLCNFLILHKHKAGWLRDNKNVNKSHHQSKAKAGTPPGNQQ